MRHNWRQLILSLAAGAAYPLGFAPFNAWLISIVSLAIIFLVWLHAGKKTAMWSALLFGLGAFGVGVSWVYVSMVNFGNMVPIMAAIAVLLFALILSSFIVALAWLERTLFSGYRQIIRLLFCLPALWVMFEYLRGVVLSGFPWLQLGYVTVGTSFAGWASISGVLLSSYVLSVIAGVIALCYVDRRSKTWLSSAISLFGLGIVSWLISQIAWTETAGAPLDVTLIQADIPLSEKWQPENRPLIMQTYLAASQAAIDTDLIIWPEGALPMAYDQIPKSYLEQLNELEASLIFGVVKRDKGGGEGKVYNALALLNGAEPQLYRKHHLVPFGEFFPFKFALGWIFESLNIPMSNFNSGAALQDNLSLKHLKILPTICYEDAFPEDWRKRAREANVILNISEDAWFGDSFAPHQRLQMARMRAVEFGRPVIRVSNSGLSTIINADGSTDAVSPQFQPALFNSPVLPMQGETPYMRFGQWPLWGWFSLCFAVIWGRRRAYG